MRCSATSHDSPIVGSDLERSTVRSLVLEEAGLIEALPDDERRKPYAMTDHGRTELVRRLEGLRRVVKEGDRRLV